MRTAPQGAEKLLHWIREPVKEARGRPRTRRGGPYGILSARGDPIRAETKQKEETYEEAYLELSYGAGPVPDAAARCDSQCLL